MRKQTDPVKAGAPPNDFTANPVNMRMMLAYVADLELEVDRLRKHGQFVHQEAWGTLKRIQHLCADRTPPLAEIDQAARELMAVLRDLRDPPGYHPAHDQVIALALRPLVEQVFRWQQRLLGAPNVVLRLELESEHVEWFPARLRHILDNIISNALRYRDAAKDEMWVQLVLRLAPEGYELRVSDNGVGLPPGEQTGLLELVHRAAPTRAAGLGVGLAVVKSLVEQSGGTLTMTSGEGQGTTIVVVLPRFDVADYLT